MPEPAWLHPTSERLEDLLRMSAPPNEYNAPKVSAVAFSEAWTLLIEHMPDSVAPPRIVPLLEGGLLIEWHHYHVDLTLSVWNDGRCQIRLVTEDTAVPLETEREVGRERVGGLLSLGLDRIAKLPPPFGKV